MKIYKVGGAVRDSLMGVKPSDTDWVVVGSSPEEMISRGYKPIGKDFPVFLHPKTNDEYALARTEKKTGTGYSGFTFYYGADVSLEEDLFRRDFTINAIAQDSDGSIIDPFNGQKDIENKLFKHVSKAFYEDPLRAIRLARFFSYKHLTEFSIDELTIKRIEKIVTSGEIASLSSNRIWSETERALCRDHPSNFFEKIIALNLCDPFFKELKQPNCESKRNKVMRWAELQINNNFALGENFPLPNEYKNIANIAKNLIAIDRDFEEDKLVSIVLRTDFSRNNDLIIELTSLPVYASNRNYILRLAKEINNFDFSFLGQTSSDKIEEEKIKIYKEIINKSK
jgi:tRNA nucleotidyltransferase/poly(A) polymerase